MNSTPDFPPPDDFCSTIDGSHAGQQLETAEMADALNTAMLATEDSEAFSAVHPDSVKVEILAGAILLSLLAGGGAVGAVICWFFFQSTWIFWSVLGAGFVLLLLIAVSSFFWPPIHFRHLRWRLDEQSLEIRRGVLWKHRISIPLGRVQHADVSQGPLQRLWKLATLTVHTAGTLVPSISLEGLEHTVAIEMRDELVRQTQDSQTL